MNLRHTSWWWWSWQGQEWWGQHSIVCFPWYLWLRSCTHWWTGRNLWMAVKSIKCLGIVFRNRRLILWMLSGWSRVLLRRGVEWFIFHFQDYIKTWYVSLFEWDHVVQFFHHICKLLIFQLRILLQKFLVIVVFVSFSKATNVHAISIARPQQLYHLIF